ncbi:AAA family ATPase [Christiangramia portivictoriae]|uniref:AAA family ATPase n=1 Tax=Christiangramia portivictoriae TaxID=326069 RepID=UPI000427D4F3|nr:AAA family ATPase [Christiangramia portivictoriae]
MKILKIEFENINSLKGSYSIDFTKEPFTTNSLFAITGPTGSGKSTILDVISLALFNHVPRLGKITKNEIATKGAILTRNQKNAMARITYSCNSGIYSSQWSIEINRNNNLNDYEMELHDHQSGKLIDLKKSLIPGKNEELIGLNYDQFIKAVLLAQGEFAQFLRAKKEERGELLEKITGTGIYRQLGIRAFEKNKEASQEIILQQNEIRIIDQNLLDKELLTKKRRDLKEKSQTCENSKTEIEKIKKAIELKRSVSELETQLHTLKSSEKQTKAQLEVFEREQGKQLKFHEKVEPKAEKFREWSQNISRIRELEVEKTRLSNKLISTKKNIEELLKNASTLVQSKLSEENIEKSLFGFREQVLDLQQKRADKLSLYNTKKEQLKTELRDTEILVSDDVAELKSSLNSAFSTNSSELNRLLQKHQVLTIVDISEEKEKLRVLQKRSRDAYRSFMELQDCKKESGAILEQLKILEPELKSAPERINNLSKDTAILRSNLENKQLSLENLKLRASLQEHRKNLVDGKPCPLCGATHHPLAEDNEANASVLETEITSLSKKYESSRDQLTREASKLETLRNSFTELSEKLKTLQQQEKEQIQQLSIHFEEFSHIKTREEFQEYEKSLEEKLQDLAEMERYSRLGNAYKNALPIAEALQEIIEAGKTLKLQIERLYSGSNIQNDVQQLHTNWIRLLQERDHTEEQLAAISSQYAKIMENQRLVESDLANFCEKHNFESIEEARKNLLSESQASDFRKERQLIADRLTSARASGKTLLEQLSRLKKIEPEQERDMLEKQLQEKTTELASMETACKEIERVLKNYEEQVDRKTKLQEEIAEKEKLSKRWRILNELIGDSKGKKFNDFAQDLTLFRLLSLANVRLKDLNDRYLIDKPEEKEDDGLVAIDQHMGGQRRSVKTLSGGETFILSLSMALALSDLASKNVEINSLFIDEGFGTLDPETLDQTLDTLERLQAESSKTIGIISHVDSLKERISTQIKLTRNGQGYSSLEIT